MLIATVARRLPAPPLPDALLLAAAVPAHPAASSSALALAPRNSAWTLPAASACMALFHSRYCAYVLASGALSAPPLGSRPCPPWRTPPRTYGRSAPGARPPRSRRGRVPRRGERPPLPVGRPRGRALPRALGRGKRPAGLRRGHRPRRRGQRPGGGGHRRVLRGVRALPRHLLRHGEVRPKS